MLAEQWQLLRVAPRRALLKVTKSMTSILYNRLAALLAETKEDDWRKLANQTGLHFAWIRSIAKGDTVRPSADKAELLIKAISGEIVCFKVG